MFIVVICMSWKLEICSPPDKGDVRIFFAHPTGGNPTGALAPWAVCRWLVVSSVASVVCGRAALWPTYFWAVVLVRQFTCDL